VASRCRWVQTKAFVLEQRSREAAKMAALPGTVSSLSFARYCANSGSDLTLQVV
jgi:hypothetical protein